MIAPGNSSVNLEDILKRMSEGDILAYYLGINKLPVILNSPLRKDKNPSFGLYSTDGKRIYYHDFATKERGGLFDLLGNLWGCNYHKVLEKIDKDIPKGTKNKVNASIPYNSFEYNNKSIIELKCKIREWRDYDLEYWNSYGVTLEWLKYADVYPISHKIIIKDGKQYVFGADKYAYVFIEKKEGKITQKIYQPFNKNGYKWQNKHDKSVISLWTKIPQRGDKLVICSSLKDALCLSCNTKIPTLALQGEGYGMSKTAINELKERFNQVFVLFDSDNAGIIDGKKLSEETGFTYLELPQFKGGKDISDLMKIKGKEEFIKIIMSLFLKQN